MHTKDLLAGNERMLNELKISVSKEAPGKTSALRFILKDLEEPVLITKYDEKTEEELKSFWNTVRDRNMCRLFWMSQGMPEMIQKIEHEKAKAFLHLKLNYVEESEIPRIKNIFEEFEKGNTVTFSFFNHFIGGKMDTEEQFAEGIKGKIFFNENENQHQVLPNDEFAFGIGARLDELVDERAEVRILPESKFPKNIDQVAGFLCKEARKFGFKLSGFTLEKV